MNSTISGESSIITLNSRLLTRASRIEGALSPWIEKLSAVLLQVYPLLDDLERESLDGLPPPRVTITDADKNARITRKDPLVVDREYHTATVVVNRRITAEDWYQDVRHFEFELAENVE